MSVASTDLHWSSAQEAAAHITDMWAREEGPGGAIVLFDAKDIKIEACGGLESLATGTPFSSGSVVRYASITKHIFAAMALSHGSKLTLEDRLGTHLPNLRSPMADVTVGRALDMTGGLPDVRDTLSLLGLSVYTATDAQPILEFLYSLGSVNFPAGHEISYSNTGYRLVEAALKNKGLLFDELIQESTSRPLGIALRAPERWFDPVPGLVPGYWRSKEGWQLGTAGLHLSASGSLTGSARDLAIWLQALLGNRGPGAGWLERLSAPRFLADGRATRYGLGLAWSQIGTNWLVGHGGSHAGYKNYFLLDPQRNIGIVIVSNREDTAPSSLALQVMASLLGHALPSRSISIPNGLYATDSGPFWLEMKDGVATFLGAGETLYQGEDGWSVSLSAHMPMRLRWTGNAIEGEVGHVARRFFPVQPDDCLSYAQGHWICPAYHSDFTIRGDKLEMGVGPARTSAALSPLGGKRLLMDGMDGPWTKRSSLVFDGNHIALFLNRSRVIQFERAT
ncbi:serine hydrolase [Microvirga sp. 17 mud 1-3]|uniref:serine hydrolase domain-containing protein n=1 Tax=Microvirga sp. 17 mud 1-3 TaxID=2082949 RepID=UPI000D6BC6F8|nr:serine hydrolase domain-containing protein [Microvirga sp. 17 mud 1-3]AWM85859.1 serine hydrolase [Microvirga sp. 17 mud 1-3]